MTFHMVQPQQELRLRVFFLMSMQRFVRMIPLLLHIPNQSSRKLRHLQEGRCQQVSIPTGDREPPRIGTTLQPPRPTTSRPEAAQAQA